MAAGRDGADGERHPGFIPAGTFVGTNTAITLIDSRSGAVVDGPFELDGFDMPDRPRTRADCIDGPRPCPWVGCRFHTQITVNPETGHIKFHFAGVKEGDLDGHPETCALDIADGGGVTLNEIGESMSLSRERIRQVEVEAMRSFKSAARRLKVIDS